MRRRCGSGGKSHSFWAMYSLKMSVCSVPSSAARSTPWRSAATRYMQKTGTAGPLIVIDVVTSPSGMPSNSTSMSAAESIATPQWPDLAERLRVVGVAAHQGRHVEGDRQAAAAGAEDHLVALVGLLRVAEAGELPDRPGPAAVAGRVEAPGERELPRPADPLEALDDVALGRPVDRLDLDAGQRGEVGVADPRARRTAPASARARPRSPQRPPSSSMLHRRDRPLRYDSRPADLPTRRHVRLVPRDVPVPASRLSAWRRATGPCAAGSIDPDGGSSEPTGTLPTSLGSTEDLTDGWVRDGRCGGDGGSPGGDRRCPHPRRGRPGPLEPALRPARRLVRRAGGRP